MPWDDGNSDGYIAEELLSSGKPSTFLEQYKMGEVLGPARHYLGNILNGYFDGINPRLVAELGYKVAFTPKSLLDALWLMFMLEVEGTTKTCWHCGSPFDSKRKDNVYCSNNCKRMAFYYKNMGKGGRE